MRSIPGILLLSAIQAATMVARADDDDPLTIDLDDQAHRQVLVDREPGQYLGHPTTCLLEDGKTIL